MDEKTQAELKKAWNYLQANQPEQARLILVEIVRQDPKVDLAWYLLSFALPDRKQQSYALERTLALNPGNEKARQRLAKIRAESAAGQANVVAQTPPAVAPPPVPKPPVATQAKVEPPQSAPVKSQTAQTAPAAFPPQPEKLFQAAAPAPEAKKPLPRKPARPAKRSLTGVILLAAALSLVLVTATVGVGLVYFGYLDLGGLFPGGNPLARLAPTATSTPTMTLPPPTATASPSPTPTSTPTLTPTITPRPVVFSPANCTFKAPEGVRVECGYVDVPEERGVNSLDSVRLMLAIYHSVSSAPAPAPVLFLQGGPGADAVQLVPVVFDSFIKPILQERDFIVFDQRGAGLSQPSLDCRELVDVYLQDLRQPFANDQRQQLYITAFEQCHNRLKLTGVNPEAYVTAASAADVHDIVTVLGYEQVDLLAYSYGTRLAQVVMREYPELVRSAVLDSVVPLEVKLFNQIGYRADYALKALFANCAADSECNTAFPDLEQVFYSQVERLDAEPVEVEVPSRFEGQPYVIRVDGAGLVSSVVLGLYTSYYIPYVPKSIYDVQDGNYSYLETMLGYQIQLYDGVSLGVQASINCHEQLYATTPQELDADLARFPRLKNYALSAIYSSDVDLFEICDAWGAAPYDPAESEPLTSSLPALILAGEYDPTTPASFGKQLHANLSASYFVEIPGMGHSPSFNPTSDCPVTIIQDFLDDPTRQPDISCLEEMERPAFVLPFDSKNVAFAPFTNREYSIQGVVPKGWKAISYGFYNRQLSPQDPTQIGMQASVNVSTQQWLDFLMTKFQGVGLDAEPRFLISRKANGLTWRLYRSEYKGNPVDIALAENGKGLTYAVIMLSPVEEHEQLFSSVYLPVIDALKPLE